MSSNDRGGCGAKVLNLARQQHFRAQGFTSADAEVAGHGLLEVAIRKWGLQRGFSAWLVAEMRMSHFYLSWLAAQPCWGVGKLELFMCLLVFV